MHWTQQCQRLQVQPRANTLCSFAHCNTQSQRSREDLEPMPRPAAHARRVVALLSLAAAFLAPQTRTRHHRLHAKKPPPSAQQTPKALNSDPWMPQSRAQATLLRVLITHLILPRPPTRFAPRPFPFSAGFYPIKRALGPTSIPRLHLRLRFETAPYLAARTPLQPAA